MSNYTKIVIAAIASTVIACSIFAGAILATTQNAQQGQAQFQAQVSADQNANQSAGSVPSDTQKTFPTGWLISEEQGVPALMPVQLFYLPNYNVAVHEDGIPADATAHTLPEDATKATILYNGQSYQIDPSNLLVNMPDLLPNAIYDIQYAYSAPSRSNGNDIPGLTGQVLEGYSPKSENPYLAEEQYVVPCAYGTAMKLVEADKTLWDEHNYRIVFWDIYRPYRASQQISSAFQRAYDASPEIQRGVGGWDLSWYAAAGPSGHNFATDVDLAVADASGKILMLPSNFDAFDETAHLTTSPMKSSEITDASYRQEIKNNQACMALHDAMKRAGFGELASEWWHFSDGETKETVSEKIGNSGLDFIASL